jgi:polyhydroxyalkanoate synthesis regulator phasin
MGILDKIGDALQTALGLLALLVTGPQRIINGQVTNEADVDDAAEKFGGLLEESQPADEVGSLTVGIIEEAIINDLVEAGEITPEDAGEIARDVEGGAVASIGALGLAGSAAELASIGQVDQQQEWLMQAVAALQLDDVTGTELKARIQEGIGPALTARVGKEHRAKFVDLPDAVEFLVRHKDSDSGFLRGENVDSEAFGRIQSNEPVNPENALEEWGIRDDQLPILEEVALQTPEFEELLETPLQLGVLPTDDAIDDALQLSGLPESIKALFRETAASATAVSDLWEQQTVADELVPQLDERVQSGQLSPDEAVAIVPDEISQARDPLRRRWELLADLPTRPPSATDVENGLTNGLIDIDRATDLLADVDVDPEAHPYILQETILSDLDGDLRTAVGLGLIEEGQYVELAELVGLDEDIVSRLLQGEDLDDIAESRLQEQQEQGAFPVDVVSGIGESRRQTLEAAGIETITDLADAGVDEVLEVVDVSEATATEFIERAQRLTEGS